MPILARSARVLLSAFVLLSIASLPAAGCKKGPAMEKIEAPAEGLQLKYDLRPGQVYEGRVSRSEAVRDIRSGSSFNRSIKFNVTLAVRGEDPERGGIRVNARFTNIDPKWALPPGTPFSLNEFLAEIKQVIEGMEVTFNVDASGKILFLPTLPENIKPELGIVIQQVLDALEAAFLTVPGRALKIGESWTDEKKRGREGKLGKFVQGKVTTTVSGYYRTPESEEVVELTVQDTESAVTTTKSGSHSTERKGKSTSLFSTSGSYLRSTVSEFTDFDPGVSNTISKLDVRWTKVGGGSGPEEVQAIADPCDPNYVGEAVCQTIADPCDPNYVGEGECKPPMEEGAGEAPAAEGGG
ncbi:MAG: hypothetical protein R3B09_11275 [Nannocystaceae bacterium]